MRYFISFFTLSFGVVALSGCGGRTDVDTEHGRQAIIEATNAELTRGNCQAALDTINPLYGSVHVNDEVRVLKSSAEACSSGMNSLTLFTNITSVSNQYQALAKSLQNTLNDGKIAALYRAVDVLTQNGTKMSATHRGRSVNNFMVFLQLTLIGAIIDAYGNGTADGAQTTTLAYLPAAAGTLSNTDACALAAAHSFAVDSFYWSDIASNSDALSTVNALNARCVAIGFTSCTAINKDRTLCDGANQVSLDAASLTTAVDSAW